MNAPGSENGLTPALVETLQRGSYEHALSLYREVDELGEAGMPLQAALGKADRYYLLVSILGRTDALHPWLYERCREVEAAPDGYLDLWSRGHYKSTVISFAGSIQEILKDPEITIGIAAHTRPIATAFLAQIKRELEVNSRLKLLYPDILWADPKKEAAQWSEQGGITVKRKSNPKESTIEAWGVVEGQPTALDVNTPILTTDGWKPHGDLEVGDMVYGSSGKPVRVIHNTGEMFGKRCIKVVLDDTEIVAAEDHLWPIDHALRPLNTVTKKQDTGWTVTEREIVKTAYLPISVGDKRDKSRRLLTTPVLSPPALSTALEIDPYIFGWWLGDGSSDSGIITTGDYEVLPAFESAGFNVIVAQDRGKYKMFRLLGLREKLKAMGLLWNKHIPRNYLYASVADRLALFQGLMDSDGNCRRSGSWGQCVFTNTNTTLIEHTHFLAASLGIKPARIRSVHDGDPNHNIRHSFSFTGTMVMPPFRLARKLTGCVNKKTNGGRYVHELVEVESVPVNCIQVEHEDGIYLAGRSLVPTHNLKHFALRIYDDMVTLSSVTTPEQMQKTALAWELSLNLGSKEPRCWYVGTRYSFGDLYQTMIERKAVKPRLHPATDDGTIAGKPVFLSQAAWDELVQTSSEATIACQQLQNPTAGMQATFRVEWVRRAEIRPKTLNVYVMCDPASSKKKDSDNTAIAVIGVDAARNKYLLDGVRQKLNLRERWVALYALRVRWMREPGVQAVYVGYERYGMRSDLEYFEERMEIEGDSFPIRELAWPMEGPGSKSDRIQRLLPDLKTGRFYLPAELDGESSLQIKTRAQGQPYLIQKPIRRKDENGRVYDLGKEFCEELRLEPFGTKRDLIDAASRIYDMDYAPPVIIEEGALEPEWVE